MSRARHSTWAAALSLVLASSACVTGSPAFDPQDEFSVSFVEIAGGSDAHGQLDAFWSEVFRVVGDEPYASPSRIVRYVGGELPQAVACAAEAAAADWAATARYCAQDGSLAVDEAFLRALAAELSPIAPVAVLAHEWGHHVQALLGLPTASLAAELQADCFAGMYLKFGNLDETAFAVDDLDAAMATFFATGAEAHDAGGWFDPLERGVPETRTLAFATGWLPLSAWPYCLGYANYREADLELIGPYRLVNLPGYPAQVDDDPNAATAATPHGSLAMAWITLPVASGATSEQVRAVMEAAYGEEMRPIADAQPLETGTLLGGGVLQYFELAQAGDGGVSEQLHGHFALLVPVRATSGLVVVVQRSGPAPSDPLDEAELQELEQASSLLFLLLRRLCGPDSSPLPGQPTFHAPCVEGM